MSQTITGTAVAFSLTLPGMVGQPDHPSSCRVRVVGDLGRPISAEKEVAGTDGDKALGPITVKEAEQTGLLVTNGTGRASMVSDGNAMTLLIDGQEAFGSAAADMEAADGLGAGLPAGQLGPGPLDPLRAGVRGPGRGRDEPVIQLARRTVQRLGADGVRHPVHPKGLLLRTDPSRPPDAEPPLRIEEEVPREGVLVERGFQYARWFDGTVLLWLGRRKTVGRGESSSGLRFDVLDRPQG